MPVAQTREPSEQQHAQSSSNTRPRISDEAARALDMGTEKDAGEITDSAGSSDRGRRHLNLFPLM